MAAILLIAGCVWAAKSGTSFESHLGARILMGFAAGATESILPLILSDYTFVHERAAVFGLFSFVSRVYFRIAVPRLDQWADSTIDWRTYSSSPFPRRR